MVGGCGGATGAVAMPCEVIATVRGALICMLSTIKAYFSFDFYFGLHFEGQFDPQDELLPPLTHIPIDAELNLLHVGTLNYWVKVNFGEVI